MSGKRLRGAASIAVVEVPVVIGSYGSTNAGGRSPVPIMSAASASSDTRHRQRIEGPSDGDDP